MTETTAQPVQPVPVDPPQPPARRRRRLPVGAVLVLVAAVVAALICWRHLRDDRPHAAAGETFAATQPLPRTTASRVETPAGGLDIRATGPLSGVDADPAVRDHQAPDGGSFVGLQIVRSDEPVVTRYRFRDTPLTANYSDTDFALVADGRRYPVREYDSYGRPFDEADDARTVTQVAQRVYVAVAGTPRTLSLEVSYAGRTQRVDLRTGKNAPGPFAALYRNRDVRQTCGTTTYERGFGADVRAPACRVDLLQRTPYYPARGWAPTGKEWLVLGLTTTLPQGLTYRAGSSSARYEVFGLPDMTFRVNGTAPIATGLFSNVFSTTQRFDVSLFAVDTGAPVEVEARAVYDDLSRRSDSVRGNPPVGPTTTASWEVGLR